MHITTAVPEEWSAALGLALRHLGPDILPERVVNALKLVAQGVIDPRGIFVARDKVGLCGVQICVPLAGAGGLVWLPRTDPADGALEERLVQVGLDWLRVRGAKIAQAILSPADKPLVSSLLRRGFQPTTRLQYLEHALDTVPVKNARHLRYHTYSQANRELFQLTLLRTYEGSLDCPELNGVRTIEEIIAGHMAQGNFRPERWWLAYDADRPVAVGMVTAVPDLDAWDLSYLGVVPEARRRGLGRALTEQVLQVAQQEHAPKLTLAVDDRNRPALQLYESLGFQTVDFRDVYLYFLDRPLASPV